MSDTSSQLQPGTKPQRARPRDLRLLREYVVTLLDPEFRPIFGLVVGMLATGTVVYSFLENWSFLDSLYFSVVTLSTIGYGDLAPTSSAAKLFTIFYIFVGVGTLGVFISAVSRASLRRSMERQQAMRYGSAAVAGSAIDSDL